MSEVVTTQPISNDPQQIEETDSESAEDETCCCAVKQSNACCLPRFIGWCCVSMANNTEDCCEMCANCITACCEADNTSSEPDVGWFCCDCDNS